MQPMTARPKSFPKHKKRYGGPPARPAPAPQDDGVVRLYGLHAVEAALANSARRPLRLLATENAAHRLAGPIAARGLKPDPALPHDLDRLLGADAVHQGVMLEVEALPEPTLADLMRRTRPGAPLMILDQVTDPHNVGAILRSSAAFGVAGLIMTRRHSPPLNGVLAKAASGALDLVPVLLVQNLARTLAELKADGIAVIGLDGEATARLEDEPFNGRTAIVMGAEGKGLRELTGTTCDRLVRIATAGTLASLNVSNAAAVALHLAAMRAQGLG